MPNSSAADRRDSKEIGLGVTPGQLRGWKDAGYGPAEEVGRAEYLGHFRALAPLMGTGRNGNVAVLKVADGGRACRRLAEVLRSYAALQAGEVDSRDADELVEYFKEAEHLDPIRNVMQSAVGSLETPAGLTDSDRNRWVLLGSAMLPFAEVTVDEPLQPGDLADLSLAEDAMYSSMGIPIEWDFDDPTILRFDLSMLRNALAIVREGVAWIEGASSAELVRGVRAANVILEATESSGLLSFSSDEERWHWIGRMTPSALGSLKLYSSLIEALRSIPEILSQLPEAMSAHLDAMARRSDDLLGESNQQSDLSNVKHGSDQ